MERTIEKTAKTVELAVRQALKELSVSEDFALIEVLDEGEPGGLLGFGRRPARVRVTAEAEEDVESPNAAAPVAKAKVKVKVEDDDLEDTDELEEKEERDDGWKVPAEERGFAAAENAALDYIEDILSGVGIHGKIESYLGEDESLHIDISGSDSGVAIGRHGETLDALQYLTNIVSNRYSDTYLRVVVDVAGYRSRREQRLQQQAKRMSERVLDTGRESRLKPMTPAERRIVHMKLREIEGITTYSEGAEPRRYEVISPTAGLELIGCNVDELF